MLHSVDDISSVVNTATISAQNWTPPKDPLVLDLDGNGITTSAINPLAPILFDQDGDGTKTATGWIASGEAIVVRDLNGNGKVDSGRELFGDNTVLTRGPRAGQTAANGFEALADLDSNADGKFDASDAAFTSVKLWKDANQNGISEAGELFTFSQLGVASINVTGTATNINLGGGNTQTHSGNFTRTSGQTGTAGTAELAGSLLLANNNFYREFTDDPVIISAAQALPQMQGSGLVRDLRPAMSLGTAQAADLQVKLATFAADTTRAAQLAHLDALVQSWGATSAMATSIQTSTTLANPAAGAGSITAIAQFAQSNPTMYAQITALERFNGQTILDKWVRPSGSGFAVSYSAPQEAFINQAYDALTSSVYGALVVQTRLKPYLDSIGLVVDEAGVRFDTAQLNVLLDSKKADQERDALIDLIELNHYATPTLMATGFNGVQKLRSWVDVLATESPLRAELRAWNVYLNAASAGSNYADVYFGDSAANSFDAGAGNDNLDGGAGDDTLLGGAGDDVLDGGAGNDLLAGDYANTFQGWYSGLGNDTYRFGRGDGQDAIYDSDSTSNNVDTLRFKTGVVPGDIVLSRQGDSLLLKIAGTTDQVTLHNYLKDEGTSSWLIETIRFEDGTVWDVAAVKAKFLLGGDGDDVIVGYSGADLITGGLGNDNLQGANGDDTVDGGAGNDYIYGNAGNDNLLGGDGDDTISVDGGVDVVDGGVGNDFTIVYYAGQATILFGRGDGQDTVRGEVSYFFRQAPTTVQFKPGITAGDVVARRSGTSLVVTINASSDSLTVLDYFRFNYSTGYENTGSLSSNGVQQFKFDDGSQWVPTANTVGSLIYSTGDLDYGSNYSDLYYGNSANNFFQGFGGDDELHGGAGADMLQGFDGNDILFGDEGDDQLYGNDGDDWIDGGMGNDSAEGGAGSDTYIFGRNSGQDYINNERPENALETDTLLMAGLNPADITLSRITGYDGSDHLMVAISNTSDSVTLVRFFQPNTVDGSNHEIDKIQFADGTVWNLATIVAHVPIVDLVLSGTDGNDTLVGGSGNDTLNGGAGRDTMIGGIGNDTYVVDDSSDVVTEGANAGTDIVLSSATYTLISNIENLTLTGNASINGTGNALNNELTGNSGNNVLNGGAGTDTMLGGLGNDTYVVDNAGDVVTENFNEGIDLIKSSVTYTLSANVENLTLTGSANLDATGNSLNNTLTGNSGNNILDGGTGADTLVGGAGNDSYHVDNASDITTEAAAGGTDTVIASITWTLGTNLENLTLSGSTNINATGNTVANVITGNAGNNVLNGGAGADTMAGGLGNDTYVVDNTADVVTEALNAGTDLLQSSVTYTLSANVENLTLTGTGSIKGTGNALDNILTGNSSANVLTGGAGNDTYIVGTGDTTIEAAGGGTDTVQSAIAWTLAANVENLTLTGSSAVNGTGNTADNVLVGNSAANTLTGNAGNDTLDGKGGNDILVGGSGNDTYWLGRGYGVDTVQENDATAGNTDVAQFDATVTTDQLWFRKVSNNLEVSIIGTTDKLTISNWYLGNQYHVEQFKTSNGKTLLDSQVQNLVSAMAAFSPPAAGQTTLPSNYATSLNLVIVANWQ